MTVEKPKREVVSSEMRASLLTNRHGLLTSGQWREMVFEPLIVLLLLLVPTIMVLRSTLLAFVVGAFWMVGLAGVIGVAAMIFLRARRYARLPLYYAVMTADTTSQPAWKFWGRGNQFLTANEDSVRFSRRLAPPMPVQDGAPYMLYYLREGDRYTLLSLAPVEHPNADSWKPSSSFEDRFQRRTR